MKIALDIGSTTIKAVVLDDNAQIIFSKYERHLSQITEKTAALLTEIRDTLALSDAEIAISGSAGMGLAEQCGVDFIQEVYATRAAVKHLLPDTDVVIELGGEDAKILFFTAMHADGRKTDNLEVRMNGSCAGGTGAFIDQMATLLNVSADELDALAKSHEKIYTIASRCGVFAKSDIQPLLNQGAKKTDVAASIFDAVVNQTIAGLAQGRPITGNVVYLGGPLTFFSELRNSFDRTLGLNGLCPEHSLLFVAYGAALLAKRQFSLSELIEKARAYAGNGGYACCPPLFASQADYDAFCARHTAHRVETLPYDPDFANDVYIGIDAGSTTVKGVVITADRQILFSRYQQNGGNPIPIVRSFLEDFYDQFPHARVCGSAVTGYGEDMIRSAFSMDGGIVETMAHFEAAHQFEPDVDFIIDIGGQDIKCFQIRNGTVDNIFLNEACSSGCGSFLQTFAGAWGKSIAEFAKMGLFGDRPVDLGSRCTVFMNSSVKQAQKDGATMENISAGLSISVVKNALYKVIRTADAARLGKHIVVQGGTFLNDAVLRAFEQEIGQNVVRPNIAGLMGAYGAAIYAQELHCPKSTLLSRDALRTFTHTVRTVPCNGCQNHCALTINTFDGGRRYIGGNRCEKPVSGQSGSGEAQKYNLYAYKRQLLAAYQPKKGPRGTIGIPLVLNLYEMLPFWHTLFTDLGFEVITSPPSDRSTYLKGQSTISSDTVCYPAKLVHGHIRALTDMGVKYIFYPCLSYNLDEGKGTNHFNCPVVAYYPEVIHANMSLPSDVTLLYPYLGLHRKKTFVVRMREMLSAHFGKFSKSEVAHAVSAAFAEYDAHMARIRVCGKAYLAKAKSEHLPVIVLASRPYHVDAEINHGIDQLIGSLGAVVLSEDSVSDQVERFPVDVLNQWTYHARMYAAAKFVADAHDPDLNLVQLVSFGCGVDAITTDEIRKILERQDKIYTQIKIDEITNLGAVKIRLRSLFAAIRLGL